MATSETVPVSTVKGKHEKPGLFVRLLSPLAGHELRVQLSEDDPADYVDIDATGVYVDPSSRTLIEEAAIATNLEVVFADSTPVEPTA